MTWRELAGLPDGMIPMPAERGERPAADVTGIRRDGSACSVRASLGLPPEPAPDDDHGVLWADAAPWLP